MNSSFHVLILTRLTSESMFHFNGTIHGGNYDEVSLLQAFQDMTRPCQHCHDASAQTDKRYHRSRKTGLKRFIPSERDGDTSAPSVVGSFRTARRKPEVLAFMKKQEGESITWTAICCGVFVDSARSSPLESPNPFPFLLDLKFDNLPI